MKALPDIHQGAEDHALGTVLVELDIIPSEEGLQEGIKRAFRLGVADGIRAYAIWRDGEQFVGELERPLATVLDELGIDP